MANRDFNKIKRTIQDFSLSASEGGNGSGGLRTFRVITSIQCSTYDLTLNYTSDDNTPFYQPYYTGEEWIGVDTLLNHLKDLFTGGKVIYTIGIHDSFYGDLFEFSWGKSNPEDHEEPEGLLIKQVIEGVPSDIYCAKVDSNASLSTEDFIVDVKVM